MGGLVGREREEGMMGKWGIGRGLVGEWIWERRTTWEAGSKIRTVGG